MILQSDINRLLTCRKAIDDHKVTHTERVTDDAKTVAVESYLSVFKDNGFNSINEFLQFNSFMNLCGWLEFRPMVGECDGCTDLKEDDVPCIKLADQWKIDRKFACYYKKYMNNENYCSAVALRIKYNIQPDENGRSYLCPKRYIDYSQQAPFDLEWKV